MITLEELRNLSGDRLEDAKALYKAKRYDWAAYTCGYAVELALKRKICETLGWKGYPNTRNEFEDLKSFKTHDLNILLHLSGVEDKVKQKEGDMFTGWSIVAVWNPEMRYSSQKETEQSVALLLGSSEILLKKL